MADDKIVTKKTAAKKAATKKTADKKPAASETPVKAAAPAAEKKTATRSTPRKTAPPAKTTTAVAAAKTAGSSDKAAAPRKLSDHQGSLRQLAKTSPEQRLDMIREAAYYKAEKRQFAPGHEAGDWAIAEREIDELLARAKVMTGH